MKDDKIGDRSPLMADVAEDVKDLLAALLHEPFGCGCSAADAYRRGRCRKDVGVDVGGGINHIGAWIDVATFVEEGTTIAALVTTNEKDNIVLSSEVADMRDAVGHLSADGVVVGEVCRVLNASPYRLHELPKVIE